MKFWMVHIRQGFAKRIVVVHAESKDSATYRAGRLAEGEYIILVEEAVVKPRSEVLFLLTWSEIDEIAQNEGVDELTAEEQSVFEKCFESGISCWSEVAVLALTAATANREELLT